MKGRCNIEWWSFCGVFGMLCWIWAHFTIHVGIILLVGGIYDINIVCCRLFCKFFSLTFFYLLSASPIPPLSLVCNTSCCFGAIITTWRQHHVVTVSSVHALPPPPSSPHITTSPTSPAFIATHAPREPQRIINQDRNDGVEHTY